MIPIDERIRRLEATVPTTASGTILQRGLDPDVKAGMTWNLGIGVLGERKQFWRASTIEEVLSKAEHDLGIKY